MRIELNKNIYFNADQYCCWVTQEMPPKKGKKHPTVSNLTGYHPTIKGCFVAIARREIMAKRDINSFKALVNQLEDLTSQIADWTKKLDKKFKELKSL